MLRIIKCFETIRIKWAVISCYCDNERTRDNIDLDDFDEIILNRPNLKNSLRTGKTLVIGKSNDTYYGNLGIEASRQSPKNRVEAVSMVPVMNLVTKATNCQSIEDVLDAIEINLKIAETLTQGYDVRIQDGVLTYWLEEKEIGHLEGEQEIFESIKKQYPKVAKYLATKNKVLIIRKYTGDDDSVFFGELRAYNEGDIGTCGFQCLEEVFLNLEDILVNYPHDEIEAEIEHDILKRLNEGYTLVIKANSALYMKNNKGEAYDEILYYFNENYHELAIMLRGSGEPTIEIWLDGVEIKGRIINSANNIETSCTFEESIFDALNRAYKVSDNKDIIKKELTKPQ